MTTLQDEQDRVDGRTARARRTREAVVEALLTLYAAGDLSPTAQRVADEAGVALRTVYGHFTDMETLWAEAGQRELVRLSRLAQPIPTGLPLEERIERFCAQRAAVLEALLPVMRAARLREPFSPQLLANKRLFVEVGDREVARVFGTELAGLDRADRSRLLDALYLAASGPAWEALRGDRGLAVPVAAQVLRRTVTALLVPAPASAPAGGPL